MDEDARPGDPGDGAGGRPAVTDGGEDRRNDANGRANAGDGDDGPDETETVLLPGEGASPDGFRAAARQLTESHPGADLDYAPASLARLDDLAGTALRESDPDERSTAVRRVGAYFGETVRRALDGEWTHEDGVWTVDVDRDGEVVGVEAFEAAVSVLRGETTFRAVYERLTDDRPVESDVATMATARAESFADRHDLDFSPASVARLDQLVVEEYGEYAALGDRAREDGDRAVGVDPEAIDRELGAVTTGLGTYLGEVLAREHGGRWVEDDGGMAITLPAGDDRVGVEVVETAAACLLGDLTFLEVYEGLLTQQAEG